MAISDKISIETRFQLNNATKNFKITDDTDYASEGIVATDVTGILVITNPLGGIIHTGTFVTPDIDLDVSTFITSIALPLDSLSAVLSGRYTIVYTSRVGGAVQPGDYSQTFTYDYDYVPAVADVEITVDLINSKLTSTDVTAYPSALIGSTRTHTVHPPAGLDPIVYPVQTTATVTNVYTPITTKTWTGKISNVIALQYAADLATTDSEYFVDDTISGNTEKNILSGVNVCNMVCILAALSTEYENALRYNPVDAVKIYNTKVAPAQWFAHLFTWNIQCGRFAAAEAAFQDLLDFTGADPSCACSDSDTPTLIVAEGSGSSTTSVVDACGTNSALTVTPVTVGSTTTYTICFNNTIWTKINALTETDITSTGGTVTVTSATSGYAKTYNLEVATAIPVHSFSGILDMDFSSKVASPTLSWRTNWSTLAGDRLQVPTIVNTFPVFADWVVNPNCFYLSLYIDQSGGEYPKPIMQIAEMQLWVTNSISCGDRRPFTVKIQELDTVNNRIYFKIVDSTGNAVGGQTLTSALASMAITVIINA